MAPPADTARRDRTGAPDAGRGLVLPSPAAPRAIARALARQLADGPELLASVAPALPATARESHRGVIAAVRRAVARDPRAALSCFASPTVATALRCAVGSSRVDLQACKLEYSIVSPK